MGITEGLTPHPHPPKKKAGATSESIILVLSPGIMGPGPIGPGPPMGTTPGPPGPIIGPAGGRTGGVGPAETSQKIPASDLVYFHLLAYYTHSRFCKNKKAFKPKAALTITVS